MPDPDERFELKPMQGGEVGRDGSKNRTIRVPLELESLAPDVVCQTDVDRERGGPA